MTNTNQSIQFKKFAFGFALASGALLGSSSSLAEDLPGVLNTPFKWASPGVFGSEKKLLHHLNSLNLIGREISPVDVGFSFKGSSFDLTYKDVVIATADHSTSTEFENAVQYEILKALTTNTTLKLVANIDEKESKIRSLGFVSNIPNDQTFSVKIDPAMIFPDFFYDYIPSSILTVQGGGETSYVRVPFVSATINVSGRTFVFKVSASSKYSSRVIQGKYDAIKSVLTDSINSSKLKFSNRFHWKTGQPLFVTDGLVNFKLLDDGSYFVVE